MVTQLEPSEFVFDFDGTIADSLNLVFPIYNSVAERFDVPRVSAEDIPRLKRMSPRQAMEAYGIPFWKVPRIMHAVRQELRIRIDRLEPFAGVRETLLQLHHRGASCRILTSNSRENVEAFLARHELRVFHQLSCGSSLFGKGPRLRRLLKESGHTPGSVIYVGDETRDIEAARIAGVRCVAVSWGYADRGTLALAAPDVLIDRPEELLSVFEQLQQTRT